MSHYLAQWQNLAAGHEFALERLIGTPAELRLELTDEADRVLVVRFDAPLAYRRLDEGDALTMLAQIAASGGNGKTFYEVKDSDFLAWFLEQNHGIWKNRGLRHFTITTMNDVIDVLALEPPILKTEARTPEAAQVRP